jgi:predicted PhzF superfamily epimerase YddE/YHI9
VNSHPIYLVDAFTDRAFAGNPAAIVPLPEAGVLGAETMQLIGREMNQAETAFLEPTSDPSTFGLRWFTPAAEVDLCGHATLAAAHTLWETGRVPKEQPIGFNTRSGLLTAKRSGDQIELDFPNESPSETPLPFSLSFLGAPLFTGKNRMDWIVEIESPATLRSLKPAFADVAALGMRGLIVTAKGDEGYDFVSRFFAPQVAVDEDPVTGSAHCCLGPYWAAKLGKTTVRGFQASARGGAVTVEIRGDRVGLLGSAVTTVEGTLKWL